MSRLPTCLQVAWKPAHIAGEAREILHSPGGERRVRESETVAAQSARWGTIIQCGLVALLIALFLLLGIVVKSGRTLAFDERAHHFVRGPVPTAFEEEDTSLRTRLMRLGPNIGTATVFVAPLAALILWYRRRRRAALLVIANTVGAFILTLCLKGVFQRTRSGDACHHGPLCVIGYLFPSTHTILTLVTYGLLGALIASRFTGARRALVIVVVIFIIAFVAVSLIYLNTHYLTDVLGGFLIGGAWLIVSLHFLRSIEAWSGLRKR
ncbi:MAG: phosphatase PAP2 family protein [Thermomicrobia bacterium]|nr:phosphatase PAP2 family protein [Thermomicrobia bacterium]